MVGVLSFFVSKFFQFSNNIFNFLTRITSSIFLMNRENLHSKTTLK